MVLETLVARKSKIRMPTPAVAFLHQRPEGHRWGLGKVPRNFLEPGADTIMTFT